MTDQDEESVLSNSYPDRHSNTADSSTSWGRQIGHSSEREPKPRTTERKDKDSYKSSDKDYDRNRDRSKKSDNRYGSDRPRRCSPRCKDYDGDRSNNSKHKKLHGHESPFNSRKAKQRCRASTSPLCGPKKSHTPECQPLLPPPIFHSTPLAVLHKLSSDPASTGLSFNKSQSSLPPLDLGESNARPISSVSMPVQAGTPSVAGPTSLPSMSVSALNLTADHTKLIFNLACEG